LGMFSKIYMLDRICILQADDMNDALAVVGIVERHTRMCFIGRGNRRPNRKSYIMTYWE